MRARLLAALLPLAAACCGTTARREGPAPDPPPPLAARTPEPPRPLRILLTNDDGLDAVGIQALKAALRAAGHEVTLMAPRVNTSGAGASLTTAPVRLTEPRAREYAVDGSPATCVFLARELGERPDLVVSGINSGANLGRMTPLSGTVGAALAALLCGFPALAVSTNPPALEEDDPAYRELFARVASFTARLVGEREARRAAAGPGTPLLPAGTGLNVNYPNLRGVEAKGVKFCAQGRSSPYRLIFEQVRPGIFRVVLPWNEAPELEAGADLTAFAAGHVTIVPISADFTARGAGIENLRRDLEKLVPAAPEAQK